VFTLGLEEKKLFIEDNPQEELKGVGLADE
jgi:hypothetical protein